MMYLHVIDDITSKKYIADVKISMFIQYKASSKEQQTCD